MSGGKFDYKHFQAEMLAEELRDFVKEQWQYKNGNSIPDERNGGWDYELSAKTLDKIDQTATMLYKAATMAHHVDYLLSGDIGEDSFHLRWDEDKLND